MRQSKAVKAALADFQLGDLDLAEKELRNIIRRYPLFADARAALERAIAKPGRSWEACSKLSRACCQSPLEPWTLPRL